MRPARRLFLLFILGMLLSVTASWTCAMFAKCTDGKLIAVYGDDSVKPLPPDAPAEWHIRSWHHAYGVGIDYQLITECEWMGSLPGVRQGLGPQRTLTLVRVGWPMVAMAFSERYREVQTPVSHFETVWTSGIEVPAKRFPAAGFVRRLPIRPIWWGFILNSVIYAIAIGGVISMLRAVRRWRRRRHGLCEQCAYPTGTGPACPECGAGAHDVPAAATIPP
ncbi:MAG: hypothetical protein JSR77_09790 [Planctomycetes bacterium]|nr:hypothetical protein [Planctomycetota bacterium]